MVGQLIQVTWGKTPFKAGWVFPSEITSEKLFFSRWDLWRLPRSLWKADICHRFSKLVFGTRFLSAWLEICGGLDNRAQTDKTFFLRFKDGAWDIPWELLIEELKRPNNRATVCLVRSLGDRQSVALSLIDEPLKILIFKGASGGLGMDELDLNKEIALIQSAWSSLEMNVRQCIAEPVAVEARQDDFVDQLKKHEPHILWFTGHGEGEPQVQLWFSDRTWVSAKDFANFIQESRTHPFYAFFSACDTARADRSRDPSAYPPALFEELSRVRILSILAMQAPISEPSALSMTGDLFRYLSVGLPLEKAIARVRAHLLDYPPENSHPMDWATPVVWSAGIPVDKLEWNARGQRLAQYQILGRYALEWGQDRPQQLNAPIIEREMARANDWAKRSRTWIHGDLTEAEHRYHWVRTLRAIQSLSELFVLAIELKADDPELFLSRWAQDVYQRMLPGDFPEEVARSLEKIIRIPIRGWEELCSLDGVFLAIANPPVYVDDWFWKPLLSGSNRKRVGVLSKQAITDDIRENWEIDGIGEDMEQKAIEKAVGSAARLARALAVLNFPLGASYLTVEARAGEGAASGWGT